MSTHSILRVLWPCLDIIFLHMQASRFNHTDL